MQFFEEHKDWVRLPPYGQLAIVQDVASGGLITGGILDMIAVKHTPVRAVVGAELSRERMQGAKMAVNVDPTQTPVCTDPAEAAKFLGAFSMVRAFTKGAPLFGSPDVFISALKGKGMFGTILAALGMMPVSFKSDEVVRKQISTGSAAHSTYVVDQPAMKHAPMAKKRWIRTPRGSPSRWAANRASTCSGVCLRGIWREPAGM